MSTSARRVLNRPIDEDAFFCCRFRLAIEFGIFSVGTHGFVNDVAGYLGRFAGRMQEVFNLDRLVGALAQVVVLRGQRRA